MTYTVADLKPRGDLSGRFGSGEKLHYNYSPDLSSLTSQ